MSTPPPEFAPWYGVFETVRVVYGTPLFMAEHYAELSRAAETLGLKVIFDSAQAMRELPRGTSGRWRWITTAEGTRTLFTIEEPQVCEAVEVSVSPVCVGSNNWDARFKTLSYLAHAQARRTASTPEVILLNEFGHVASAASSNIFWRRGEQLFTPAHEAGCRRGVMRGFVLWREKAEVGHYPVIDLLAADEIFLTNSMRGIVSVSRVKGKPVEQTTMADRLRQMYADIVAREADDES